MVSLQTHYLVSPPCKPSNLIRWCTVHGVTANSLLGISTMQTFKSYQMMYRTVHGVTAKPLLGIPTMQIFKSYQMMYCTWCHHKLTTWYHCRDHHNRALKSVIHCICQTYFGFFDVLPGPQTVDLIPVVSSAGIRLTAPSMLKPNTSQSNSNKEKAKSFFTWKEEKENCAIKTKSNCQLDVQEIDNIH